MDSKKGVKSNKLLAYIPNIWGIIFNRAEKEWVFKHHCSLCFVFPNY
jgi:hypothetical protein